MGCRLRTRNASDGKRNRPEEGGMRRRTKWRLVCVIVGSKCWGGDLLRWNRSGWAGGVD